MKIKFFALCGAAVLILPLLWGCSRPRTPQLANTICLPLAGIEQMTIAYDEEAVTFFPAEGGELVVKEFMTDSHKRYCAQVEVRGGSLRISEGGKPLGGGFSRYIEVYLPPSYEQNLAVTTTSGPIDLSGMDLQLASLRIASTSGAVQVRRAAAEEVDFASTSGTFELGSIQAPAIRLETTSGSITCHQLTGQVTYATTSGSLAVGSAVGAGSYKASQSGQLAVAYTSVTGDLTFYNKNGAIDLTLPGGLAFAFEAETKNGSVSTAFPQDLTCRGRRVSGTVGGTPSVSIRAETKNGAIRVTN